MSVNIFMLREKECTPMRVKTNLGPTMDMGGPNLVKLCIFSYLSVKTFVVRAEKYNAVL